MNHILTVEELAEILDEAESLEHAAIMKKIKIEAHELEHYATWSQHSYTRNCLARTQKYEVILLCWDIGAEAPRPRHGGEDCWVYQVQGTDEEIRYKQVAGSLIETNRMVLTPSKLT